MIEATEDQPKTIEQIGADKAADQGNAGSETLKQDDGPIVEPDPAPLDNEDDTPPETAYPPLDNEDDTPPETAYPPIDSDGNYVSPTLGAPEIEPARDSRGQTPEHKSKVRNWLHVEAILEHLCGRLGIAMEDIRHPDEDATSEDDEAAELPA